MPTQLTTGKKYITHSGFVLDCVWFDTRRQLFLLTGHYKENQIPLQIWYQPNGEPEFSGEKMLEIASEYNEPAVCYRIRNMNTRTFISNLCYADEQSAFNAVEDRDGKEYLQVVPMKETHL